VIRYNHSKENKKSNLKRMVKIMKIYIKGRETSTDDLLIRLPKEAENKNFNNLHEVSMLYAYFLCLEEAQEHRNARLIKENEISIRTLLESLEV
jgi:urease accessory protein UreH